MLKLQTSHLLLIFVSIWRKIYTPLNLTQKDTKPNTHQSFLLWYNWYKYLTVSSIKAWTQKTCRTFAIVKASNNLQSATLTKKRSWYKCCTVNFNLLLFCLRVIFATLKHLDIDLSLKTKFTFFLHNVAPSVDGQCHN